MAVVRNDFLRRRLLAFLCGEELKTKRGDVPVGQFGKDSTIVVVCPVKPVSVCNAYMSVPSESQTDSFPPCAFLFSTLSESDPLSGIRIVN